MAKKNDKKGLKVNRFYTKDYTSVFDQFQYELRSSVIRNPAGDAVFEMHNVEVPKGWSQVATDILAQKYFRRAGVPQADGSPSAVEVRTLVTARVLNQPYQTAEVGGMRGGDQGVDSEGV